MVETSIITDITTAQARARLNYSLYDFVQYIKVNKLSREDLANQIGVSKKYVDDLPADKGRGAGAIEKYQKLMNVTGYKSDNIYIGK